MRYDFYSSDEHFDHDNIIRYTNRPFASVEEMNWALVDRWNAHVSPTDRVLVVGDVCMGKIQESLAWVGLLNGVKDLLPGNHDRCWHGKKKWRPWMRRYIDAGFNDVFTVDSISVELGETTALACHFPYDGDHTAEERYEEHRPTDRGQLLLHGHVHNLWKMNGARQINVGVDVWDYAPVSADQLVALASRR